jgi:hypothetical protein
MQQREFLGINFCILTTIYSSPSGGNRWLGGRGGGGEGEIVYHP